MPEHRPLELKPATADEVRAAMARHQFLLDDPDRRPPWLLVLVGVNVALNAASLALLAWAVFS